MSEPNANTIAESNADIYDRLLVSIEAGIDTLQVFIAVCDADRQREEIIANYERELSSNLHTYRAHLDPQEPSLRRSIASIVTESTNAMVTVLGAETLGLSAQGEEILDKFFGYLQWTREALREFQMPIVLWVPSRIFKQLAKKSPDFWSWRAGVFQFQLEPLETSVSVNIPLTPDVESFLIDDIGNSTLSIEQLEAFLADRIAKWGTDNRNLAPLYTQLGNLYAQRLESGTSVNRERETFQCIGYFNRSIEIHKKFHQQLTLSSLLDNLAELYKSLGRYTDAEPLLLRSLAICEEQLGTNHTDTATSLNNLAVLYELMGRHPDAEPLLVRSLAIYEEQLESNYPKTATALNNLAGCYQAMGRYPEAEALYVRALAIREWHLGANHTDTAISLNNLAALYKSLGKYAESESLLLRSLVISEEQLGANHLYTASALNNLAGLYASMSRYAEAEPLYVRALEIFRKTLGDNHPNTKICQRNLEMLLQDLKLSKTS